MGLTVTQRPNTNNAWSASGNPIIYKFQRKDYSTNAIANSGGALQITATVNLTTLGAAAGGPVVAGSTLWFADDGGIYNGLYTVVTVTNAANSVVTFTAGTYTSGAGANPGYINLISNRKSYRVETELYRQADNTLIFSKLVDSPAPAGLVTVDVAAILNEYIDQEPFAYLTTTTNGGALPKARRSTTTSLYFYAKYTETWTGSAEAQTNDSANPAWVAKGARQIGDPSGGFLEEYAQPAATPTRKFLSKFAGPSLWPGRKSTLSFIDREAAATPRTMVKKIRYNTDLSQWGATYDLPEYTGVTVKSIHEVLEDLTTPYGLAYDKEDGAGTSWTNLGTATPIQVVLAPAASSKNALFPAQLLLGKTYETSMSITVAAGAGAETVKVRLTAITLAGTVRYTIDSANLAQNTTTVLTFSAIIPATSDAYYLAVQIIHNGGANNRTTTLNYHRLTIPLALKVDYQLVTLTSTLPAVETVVSETLSHQVRELPDQPVQLYWRNSLGGESDWVFGFSQEIGSRFTDNNKRTRMTLFAVGLTPTEWAAIEELNTIGEVFQPTIRELNATVDKTHKRRGAQVYIVDSTGKKTGVIVIPTEVRARTRQIQRTIEITIELPEIQAAR